MRSEEFTSKLGALLLTVLVATSCKAYGQYFADEEAPSQNSPTSGGGAASINCPANYINVPANPAVGTSSDFCVAKYEMKCASDATGASCTAPAISQAANNPWVSISQADAKVQCSNVGSGYHLITNPEWMTISRDVEATASNWSSGAVNSGTINRGWAASTGAGDPFTISNLAPTTDSTCVYATGAASCGPSGTHLYKRTHTLSNGEEIWDLSGNVAEFTDWEVPQSEKIAGSGGTTGWSEFNTAFTTTTMTANTWQPLNTSLTSANGIGQYWQGTADPAVALRGGAYNTDNRSGIYSLNFGYNSSYIDTLMGFRCAYTP